MTAPLAKAVHRNPWFSVFDRAGYYTVEYHQRHVIVLPVVDEQKIVMVQVKRPLMPGGLSLELPAGACDASESAAQGAARELAEETGILVAPERLVAMPSLSISPNRTPQMTEIFRVAIEAEEYARRAAHDDEIAAVELYDLARLQAMIAVGELRVAAVAAVVAGYLFLRAVKPCAR